MLKQRQKRRTRGVVPSLAIVKARLARLSGRDMSWLYETDLTPPDGGPETIGPAVYHPDNYR